MGKDDSQLVLRDTGCTARGRAIFELARPYVIRLTRPGVRLRVAVPIGFRTDFASVPRLFWRVFNPAGQWRSAAVVHDWLYTKSALCDRHMADAIFLQLMQLAGCKWWSRMAIYTAVRLLGWTAYRKR